MHSPRTKQAKKLSPAQLSQTYSKISDLEVEKEKIFAETNKARYQIDKLNGASPNQVGNAFGIALLG